MLIRLNLTGTDDAGHVFAKDVDVIISPDIFSDDVQEMTVENAVEILLCRMTSGSGVNVTPATPEPKH